MASEAIKVNLFGIVNLSANAGNYELVANGNNLNNTVQNVVRVVVDSSRGNYVLKLPSIQSFNGFWSPQIIFTDINSGVPPENAVQIQPAKGDTINGVENNWKIGASKMGTVSIAYNERYAALGFIVVP